MKRLSLASPPALLLLAAFASAQQVNPRPLGNLTSLTSSWDPAGNGPFADSSTGDFDGDGILDVATRRGTGLEVLLAPASIAAPLSGFCAPTDFVVVHDGSLRRDVLIVAESDGLRRYDFDPSTRAWNATSLAVSSGWHGTTQLATRPLAGLADQILGVMADGKTVRALTDLGSGYVEETNAVVTTAQAIRDLQAFDRDGDGVAELACMHTSSVTVYAAAGAPGAETWSPLSSRSLSGSLGVDIARGAQTPGGKEWLVWLVTDPSDGKQYTVLIDDGAANGPDLVGAFQIVRIETGDWDGDGDDDLALSWRAEQRLGILPNQGSTRASFPATGLLRIDLTATPGAAFPSNEAQPVLADLDNDGDVEACLSVLGSNYLHMEYGQVVDATKLTPTLYLPNSSTPADYVYLTTTSTVMDASFDVQAADTWLLDEAGNEVPLTLEVDVWDYPSTASAPTYFTGISIPNLTSSDHPVEVLFPIAESQTPFDTFYFWRARYVLRDAEGTVTYSSPFQTVGFHAAGDPTTTTDGAAADQTLEDWGGVAPIEVQSDSGNSGPYTRIGSALTLPKLPDVDVNLPPV